MERKKKNNAYMLGSHNSWSYLKPKCWLLYPFRFMSRCQSVDIMEQYEDYGVRCFDLRVEFDEYGILYVAHGLMRYKIDFSELCEYLKWLNDKGDCYVRVIHEVRSESKHTELAVQYFREF